MVKSMPFPQTAPVMRDESARVSRTGPWASRASFTAATEFVKGEQPRLHRPLTGASSRWVLREAQNVAEALDEGARTAGSADLVEGEPLTEDSNT